MFCPATLAVRALLRVTTPVAVSTAVTVLEAAMPAPVTVEPTARVAAWASVTVREVAPEAPEAGA